MGEGPKGDEREHKGELRNPRTWGFWVFWLAFVAVTLIAHRFGLWLFGRWS